MLEKEPSIDRERQMLAAMIDAHQKSEAGKRAEKILEVMSWIVKPLHYVPGVDAALSIHKKTRKTLGLNSSSVTFRKRIGT